MMLLLPNVLWHPDGNMDRDQLFRNPKNPIPPFEFNTAVANVFDDMIHRSVPMYAEIIRRQAQIIGNSNTSGSRIYDWGLNLT